MILEYLSIAQTLDYLKKQTGYKYDFDNLKELSFAGKINCFFYGVYTIYNVKDHVIPAPFCSPNAEPTLMPDPIYEGIYVSIVKGIFYVKDIFQKIDGDVLDIFGNQITIENIFEELLSITEEGYHYQKGDLCYLSEAKLLDIKFYDDRKVNYQSLIKKPVICIDLDIIRFKKSELDYLIDLSEENPLSQQITDLNAQLASLQATIDRLTAENQQQAKTIQQLNDRLEQQAGKSDTPAEPMGDNPKYTTIAITALNHVVTKFWQDWQQGMTPPKQAHIEAWIIENYPTINKTTATNIDRIARHESQK